MVSQFLRSVQGVELIGILMLIACFVGFLAVLVWSVRAKKEYLKRMSELPLTEDSRESSHKVTS